MKLDDLPRASASLWIKNSPLNLTFREINNKVHMPQQFSIKMKWDLSPECLTQCRQILQRKIWLRLDGNRQYDLQNAHRFISSFSEEERQFIEYLEEPCIDYHSSQNLCAHFNIPLAFDETLSELVQNNQSYEQQLINIGKDSHACFFILRPSLLGLKHTLNCLSLGTDKQISMILSSSYEPKNAMFIYDYLMSRINHKYLHGLDTLKFIKHSPHS